MLDAATAHKHGHTGCSAPSRGSPVLTCDHKVFGIQVAVNLGPRPVLVSRAPCLSRSRSRGHGNRGPISSTACTQNLYLHQFMSLRKPLPVFPTKQPLGGHGNPDAFVTSGRLAVWPVTKGTAPCRRY